MFIILTLIEQCDNKEWALHSMVMPILLLLCIRKEHVDSKVYKYEGICILYVYDSICHYIRTYWGKYVQRSISKDCDNRSFL